MTSSRDMTIRDDSDGITWVMLLKANSRRELSRRVKTRNWRKPTTGGADCTGKVFMGTCELLRAYRVSNKWLGVIVCAEMRDV